MYVCMCVHLSICLYCGVNVCTYVYVYTTTVDFCISSEHIAYWSSVGDCGIETALLHKLRSTYSLWEFT